jgi:uncharacterized phage protein (TIGR02220 family)
LRYFTISEDFFKVIAEKGKLYSRLWVFWLGGFADELFDQDFIEKQATFFPEVSEIREIYTYGLQLLKQDFKVIKKKKPKPKVEDNGEAEHIINYLNEKSGSNFQATSSNLELIQARLKDGHKISDLEYVIDVKIKHWKGTDWEKYLRPITLFSKTKFENYLNSSNEPRSTKTKFDKFAESFAKAKQHIELHNIKR